MQARGFTVVELIVTIAVIGILLSLGTVGLQSTQANARDAERKADIKTIARGLETRYKQDNPNVTSGSAKASTERGYYPGTNEILHALGNDRTAAGLSPIPPQGGYITQLLEGTSVAALTPPRSSSIGLSVICNSSSSCSDGTLADNKTTIANRMNGADTYMYVPRTATGTTCYGSCTGFDLYWNNDSGVLQGPLRSKNR